MICAFSLDAWDIGGGECPAGDRWVVGQSEISWRAQHEHRSRKKSGSLPTFFLASGLLLSSAGAVNALTETG